MDLRTNFETRVLAAFAAAVLVVAGLAATTWNVAQDVDEVARWVAHTHEVLEGLDHVRSDSLAIELSAQNYRLTGDPAHLAERDAAIAARETTLRRLKELTADNARQQARWVRLRAVADQRLEISRRTELLRQTEGVAAASAYVAKAPLQETRERLYQILREMDEEEIRLLEGRSAAQQHARQMTVLAGALAALALAALLTATFVLIRRQLRAIEASRQALAKSEENLAITLNSIGDAVLTIDVQGRVTRMNPVAERLTGWLLGQARGRPVDEVFRLVNEQTRASAVVPVAQVLATGETQAIANHTMLLARDGREWPVADSAAPIRDADGRISGVVLVFRDVSVERQAERSIQEQNELLEQRVRDRTARWRESEEKQRLFVYHAPAAIAMFDRDMRYLAYSHRWRADYNLGDQDITGRSHYEIFPDLPERWKEIHRRCLAGAVEKSDEDSFPRADGSVDWVRWEVHPWHAGDGGIGGIIIFSEVITERKRAAQEILNLNATLEQRVAERTRQLEEANRAKSDFLANMSHELRTPLNAIIGFSEMLKDGLLGELDAKQRGFITDIFDAGTHLLSLINDILDLSKVEAGMLQLDADAVDLPALLKASTLIVREKALAHRIRIDTQLDPALGAMAGDERKLKQIVYNLLSNAVKFTPEGGAVTLSARRCTRAEVAFDAAMPARLIALPPGVDGEFLAITVEDSGVGMAEADLAKLFEPFVQVDSSIARRQGGAGLGLSLVRRFAELHGGTVGVASRPGVGSRFCVWLPYRAAVPALADAADAPPVTHESRTASALPLALVIEDDDRMADLIAAQLHAEGFEVMRAATAEEGLERAAKHQPQLITLDIFLPAMDGWEFLRRLKAAPKLADTPVVIITASADMERGLALGARRVLHKPFVREELVAALAGLVDARSNGEPARVLVVDDNVQAVELVATVLEAEGYRVLRAYGGAEAIEVARRARPDLVILDLIMPQVSGFEVARALRASEHTARIPILVLTAKDLTAEDHVRLNGAVSAIMMKAGFNRSELVAELRRAIAVRPAD